MRSSRSRSYSDKGGSGFSVIVGEFDGLVCNDILRCVINQGKRPETKRLRACGMSTDVRVACLPKRTNNSDRSQVKQASGRGEIPPVAGPVSVFEWAGPCACTCATASEAQEFRAMPDAALDAAAAPAVGADDALVLLRGIPGSHGSPGASRLRQEEEIRENLTEGGSLLSVFPPHHPVIRCPSLVLRSYAPPSGGMRQARRRCCGAESCAVQDPARCRILRAGSCALPELGGHRTSAR